MAPPPDTQVKTYYEVDLGNGGRLRVSITRQGNIQIRRVQNNVTYPGPEFPPSHIPGLLHALGKIALDAQD